MSKNALRYSTHTSTTAPALAQVLKDPQTRHALATHFTRKQAVTQNAKNTGGEDDRGGAAARAD
jgi:hypothetical protein